MTLEAVLEGAVHDLSVFDDRLPGDDRVVGRYRPAPQQRFDRVAQRTGKTGAVDSPANEVSHRARPQHPELALAAEAGRTSERRQLERFASARRRRPGAVPGQEHRRPGFQPEGGGVGRRRAVAAEPHRGAGRQ